MFSSIHILKIIMMNKTVYMEGIIVILSGRVFVGALNGL